MSIVLKNQIEACERSTIELERQLIAHHHEAMWCMDVQDLAAALIAALEDLERHVEHWQNGLRSEDKMAQESLLTSDWYQCYVKLAGSFEKAAVILQSFEESGFAVDGRDSFFAGWKRLREVVCFSPEQIQRGIDQIRAGQSRSLAEVRHALWDAPVS